MPTLRLLRGTSYSHTSSCNITLDPIYRPQVDCTVLKFTQSRSIVRVQIVSPRNANYASKRFDSELIVEPYSILAGLTNEVYDGP